MTYNAKRRLERLERIEALASEQSPLDNNTMVTAFSFRVGLLRRLDEYAKRRNISRSAAASIAISEFFMREDNTNE